MYKTLVISTLCAGAAFGQNTSAITEDAPVPGPVMMASNDMAAPVTLQVQAVLAGSLEKITDAPYTAQTVTERIQILPDGNRIVQTVSGSIARDKQGRLRREQSLPGLGPGNNSAPQIVTIDDPVAQVAWSLDAATKTAVKMPTIHPLANNLAEGKTSAMTAGVATLSARSLSVSPDTTLSITPPIVERFRRMDMAQTLTISKDGAEADVKHTDLGTQNMEGVIAQGSRITRTIPAAQIGNEMPIVITSETWYSPDLKVVVMSKSSDPRMGETNYRLTGIQRTDPSSTLFQVPDDYTVKDRSADNASFTVTRDTNK